MMFTTCRVCDQTDDFSVFVCHEQMQRTKHKFEYFECSKCGCLQISDMPLNLNFYYSNYYSFKNIQGSWIKRKLRSMRDRYVATGKGPLGWAINKIKKDNQFKYLKMISARFDAKILDVGSGDGTLAKRLFEAGFEQITCIDPYLDKININMTNRCIRFMKISVEELTDFYNIIIFNHSFEHIWEQSLTLEKAKKHLLPGGYIVLRIPTVDSFAWAAYGSNWVQLDAPRHLYLHTNCSIIKLIEKVGLTLYAVYDDSTAFQFSGSEDITLEQLGPIGKRIGAMDSGFYRRFAEYLNETGRGDQRTFLITE